MTYPRKDMMSFAQRLIQFIAGNVFTQGLVAVTGLFLVRWLSIEQYAIYTVATTVTGAVAVLSKGGTNVGFVSILGRHWPNYPRLSSAITALRHARRTLFVCLVPVVLLLAAFLLYKNSVSPLTSAMILLLLTVFWVGEMNSKTVDQILFFAHQTTRVQALDSGIALFRFALTAVLYAFGLLSASSALAVTSLMAVLRVFPINRWVFQLIPQPDKPPLPEDSKEIMAGVRSQLPIDAFYVLQGQIVLLLLSIHATTAVIAGYGAMCRIVALMAPIRVLNEAFYIPIAAKADRRVVGRTIFLLSCANAVPGLCLIMISLLVPSSVLWLVGPQYAHLEKEMYVMVVATAFSLTGGMFWNLVAHQGWMKFAYLQIPVWLLWVFGAGYIVDLSTISGALILNAGFTLPSVLIGIFELYRHRNGRLISP